MYLPNKLNIYLNEVFLCLGRAIPFSLHVVFEFGKNAGSLKLCTMGILSSFGFNLFGDNWSPVFFGAPTSVGALFVLEKT